MSRFDLIVDNFAALHCHTDESAELFAEVRVGIGLNTHRETSHKVTEPKTSPHKYSQTASGPRKRQYMSRNRAPAAHRISPKNSHKPGFDRLCERILSDYLPLTSDSTTNQNITSCVIPQHMATSTPHIPISQKGRTLMHRHRRLLL